MIKKRGIVYYGYLALCILLVTSCGDKSNEGNEGPFDRREMLANYADNLVLPAYATLLGNIDSLQKASSALVLDPTEESLEVAQHAWRKVYVHWQYANAFNFGPAGEEGLRRGLIEEIGTFPVNTDKVESALSTGTYTLTDLNRDARGIFAVEYLLFDAEGDQDAVLYRFSQSFAPQLLADLLSNINSRVQAVHDAWKVGYRDSFVDNNGTDVGSSASKFYNEFLRSFESIKNFKLALPLGLRPGQTHAEPALVEAYYSHNSIQGLKAHISHIENIWYGRTTDGKDGLGFDDYLATVPGGQVLLESTKGQLENVHIALAALQQVPSLAVQVSTSPDAALELHTELQRQTRYFKSDLSSLLGLAITFSSGDGD